MKIIKWGVLLTVVYMILGTIIPFLFHPSITPETVEQVAATPFYASEYSGERAAVISDNEEALAERIRLISQAQERVILSTFEFRSDTSGKQVLAALLDAADRGVQVQVVADGMPGFLRMERNPYFYALSAHENVEIRLYNPIRPWMPWTLMGRMHDKYLIADETAYILGGRNTYDYFLGGQEGYKNLDWDVLVYEDTGTGSLEQVYAYFLSVWDSGDCRTFHDSPKLLGRNSVKNAAAELNQLYSQMETEHPDWFAPVDYRDITAPANSIQLVSNPVTMYAKEPVVCYTITELLGSGTDEAVLHTPYIICNDWMLKRLSYACGGSAAFTLMTNSVANNGNPFGAMDYRSHKEELLATGMTILEYDGGISYHGKCATVDDRLSMVGSFNYDMRSAYIDTELMLVIDSPELNETLRAEMKRYETNALLITDSHHSQAPEGHTPQELTAAEGLKLTLMRIFLGWARFLM